MIHKGLSKLILASFLILLVAISGCLNAEIDTKLNKDFSGKRTIHLEMAPILYNALEANLSRENIVQTPGADLVSYKKDIKNEKVILDIVVNYKDLRNVKDLNILEHEKVLRFEDSTFEKLGNVEGSNVMGGSVSIKYILEMPYKIETSNADVIEENKATWVIAGLTSKTLYAESKIPAIPGFTAISVLIAGILLVIMLHKKRYKVR